MQEEKTKGFYTAEDDYADILKFAENRGGMTYRDFDAQLLKQVNLFALPEYYDFDALLSVLGKMVSALPAIKRIFARPISRLKDNSVILPVESVQVINNRTVIHASAHSELWENVTSEGLKPRKLMTLNHIDTYSIYENIAFVKAVNTMLSFVSKNMKLLRNMLYAHRDINVNLLERENHLSYFLAIGKLHIGYVRDHDKNRQTALNCLDKLIFIDRTLRARLNCQLYTQCNKQSRKPLTLKKTNIFRSHKDYRAIYNLLKWFYESDTDTELDVEQTAVTTDERYGAYCAMVSVFAAGHFNFEFPEDALIDFKNPHAAATFDRWRLDIRKITCGELSALEFIISKDREYKIILLPVTDGKEAKKLEILREQIKADEYIAADPTESDGGKLYISLYDLDSFRRLQQIFLRGMIAADETRDVCPFCGKPISKSDKDGEYECETCRTVISEMLCPNTVKSYTVTSIKNFVPDENERIDPTLKRDKQLYARYAETRMYFRNITHITENREPICPHCGAVH